MRDLALLHAAARADRVYLRGPEGLRRHDRDGDDPVAFLARLRVDEGATAAVESLGTGGRTVYAALHTGDVDLPEGTTRYCLFPERVSGTVAASDLLS
jgi:hypothetical protein